MITLIQFPCSKKEKIANFSPFCLKVETYLRATKTPFQIETNKGDPKNSSPNGKLPFVKLQDGNLIADSQLIIEHFEKTNSLDSKFSDTQRALGLAAQRLAEDHLMWTVLYQRWIDQDEWPHSRQVFFKGVPKILVKPISSLIQRRTIKMAHAQGVGRHTEENIYRFADQDFKALSDLLGEKEFFVGDSISTHDMALFGLLANCLHAPVNPKLQALVKKYDNLTKFVERINKEYYPERY